MVIVHGLSGDHEFPVGVTIRPCTCAYCYCHKNRYAEVALNDLKTIKFEIKLFQRRQVATHAS